MLILYHGVPLHPRSVKYKRAREKPNSYQSYGNGFLGLVARPSRGATPRADPARLCDRSCSLDLDYDLFALHR